MNEQEFAELSAGHALSALSPDDERAYAAALAAHPEWAAITEADGLAAAALADGAAEVAPPLAARSQLLRIIRQDPRVAKDQTIVPVAQDDSAGSESAGSDSTGSDSAGDDVSSASAPPTGVVQAVQRRNWSRGMFALVASMVLLVGIGWGAGSISEMLSRTPAESTLIQIQAAPDAAEASGDLTDGGTATVHWSESLGEVVLVSQALPEIPADRTFELWYVRGDEAISAGTFDPSGGRVAAALEGGMQAGDTIAVTIEPAGGAPDGTPTSAPIVAIPTTVS